MNRINKIGLRQVVPTVFSESAGNGAFSDSSVWLSDVTFSRPESYLITAESGTGKTSFCDFLYGNRTQYVGEILFDGLNIKNFTIGQWGELRRCHIAIMPQEMCLFPELTVGENIEIKNRLTRYKSHGEVMQMLEQLEIASKINAPVSKLSLGQQQRVAAIRALCQPFDFLLLDEPVSHLDERCNRLVAELISAEVLRQEAGVIVMSVGNPLLIDVGNRWNM